MYLNRGHKPHPGGGYKYQSLPPTFEARVNRNHPTGEASVTTFSDTAVRMQSSSPGTRYTALTSVRSGALTMKHGWWGGGSKGGMGCRTGA